LRRMSSTRPEDPWSTQGLDAIERASEFGRIDIDIPLPADTGADAAAGGNRGSVDFDTDTSRASSGSIRPPDLKLQLPIQAKVHNQARGSSSVGCANLAQVEKALSDTAVLQSRANAALERISRQQSALKRIPVACPTCGSLNVPPRAAWGVGEVVPCQECNQSFVPLSNGLQDSDVAVLKAAVHRLRAQAERIQYLEQLTAKSRSGASSSHPEKHRSPSGAQSKSKAETSSGRTAKSQTPMASRSAKAETPSSSRARPSSRSPTRARAGLDLRSPVGDTPSPSANSVQGQQPGGGSLCMRARSPLPAAGAVSSPSAATGIGIPRLNLPLPQHSEAAAGPSTAATPGAPSHQRLVSLLDTQDLLTNSSTSSLAPVLHGSRLTKNQMDTEQQAREALSHLRDSLPSGPKPRREREEGEIASASESEAGSRFCSWDLRQMRPTSIFPRKRNESSSPSPARARRNSSPQRELRTRRPTSKEAGERGGQKNSEEEVTPPRHRRDGATPGAELPSIHFGLLGSGLPIKFLVKLALILILVVFLRLTLDFMTQTMGLGSALAPAALTALISGCFMALWRAAEKEVSTHSMLETSRKGWAPGAVGVCLGGPWLQRLGLVPDLTVEEAYGLATALAQLAPVFLFENWGLHGPVKYRWVAVLAHAVAAIAVTVVTQHQLQPLFGVDAAESSKTTPQVNEVWLGLAASNWAACSWAASSWWRVAAVPQARLPALALASTQMGNFWLAQRTRQPHLLAACVALGGLSMACCCGSSADVVSDDATSTASVLLTPAIYIAFWAVSAWMLFAELLSI